MLNENGQFDTALESVTCSDSYSILWVSCEYVLRPSHGMRLFNKSVKTNFKMIDMTVDNNAISDP
jgi:hypothetical protein